MSGYRDCACRDCFEIAIGIAGALCGDCEDSGCEASAETECSAPGAYGGNEDLEMLDLEDSEDAAGA